MIDTSRRVDPAQPASPADNAALWFCFRCLPAALGVLMAILVLSASVARGDTVEEVNAEIQAGTLDLRSQSGDQLAPAVMQSGTVHFDISGMVAVVRLEQRFSNHSTAWVEGVYAFPLPDDAAVRHLEMQVGERLIVGEIKERAAAQAVYDGARKAGKKASLVAQQRPNLFTNRIANIGPGESVTIRLEYIQPARYSAGSFSLRFPMTITPRYMPGELLQAPHEALPLRRDAGSGWARATDQVPDAHLISPFLVSAAAEEGGTIHNPITITVDLDAGMPLAKVQARYHQMALTRDGPRYRMELAHGPSEMNRDFVLDWVPATGKAPRAALFTEEVDGKYYGLLMMLPPKVAPAAVPRELVFVIDTSGSMGGVAIAQARASVSSALAQLRPGDFFNIIEFNSRHRQLYSQARPASHHYVQRAREFVRQLDAGGGTEMLPALLSALAPAASVMEAAAPRLRQVIFITDGAVGNEEAVFQEITTRLGDSRLFTVGIGSAPNNWFMRKAAAAGRGVHTHIGRLDEVATQMDQLFERLSAPVATDLAVAWPAGVEAWPEEIPDLYRGKPVLQAVSFGDTLPNSPLTLSGRIVDQAWSRQLEVGADAPEAGVQHAGVGSLWARSKIESLLDQLRLGAPEEEIRPPVLALALDHKLLSPYTSFVAVERRVSRPLAESLGARSVANTAPQGQSPQHYAWPATATTGPAKAFLGLFFLFTALIVHLLRQSEPDQEMTEDA